MINQYLQVLESVSESFFPLIFLKNKYSSNLIFGENLMALRVAIISAFPENPNLILGGVAGVTVYLSRALRDLYGIDVHIITPGVPGNTLHSSWEGITIHRLPVTGILNFVDYWTFFRKRLHAKLDEIDPNITHFQGVAGWALGYSKPYVLTIHGINEKDLLYKGGYAVNIRSKIVAMVEKKVRSKSKNLIIINPYLLEELSSQIKGKTWMIENPVAELFFRIPRNVEKARVFFAGAVIKRKNVLGLIRAFNLVKNSYPAATLRIAGPIKKNSYIEACKNYILNHGLKKSVLFLGPQSNEQMQDELSKASCLALPSFQETAPLIIEEAMAAGVPILTSRRCGMPYMVEDNKTGFLVNPNSTQEIASKLLSLIIDPKLNITMSSNCKKMALKRFHINVVAKSTMNVYQKVLAKPQQMGL